MKLETSLQEKNLEAAASVTSDTQQPAGGPLGKEGMEVEETSKSLEVQAEVPLVSVASAGSVLASSTSDLASEDGCITKTSGDIVSTSAIEKMENPVSETESKEKKKEAAKPFSSTSGVKKNFSSFSEFLGGERRSSRNSPADSRTSSGSGFSSGGSKTNSGSGFSGSSKTGSGSGFSGGSRTGFGSGFSGESKTGSGSGFSGDGRTGSRSGFSGDSRTGSRSGFSGDSRTGSGSGFSGESRPGSRSGFSGESRPGSRSGFSGDSRTGSRPGFSGDSRTSSGSGFSGDSRSGSRSGFSGDSRIGSRPGFSGDSRTGSGSGFSGDSRSGSRPGFSGDNRPGSGSGFSGDSRTGFGSGFSGGSRPGSGSGFSTDGKTTHSGSGFSSDGRTNSGSGFFGKGRPAKPQSSARNTNFFSRERPKHLPKRPGDGSSKETSGSFLLPPGFNAPSGRESIPDWVKGLDCSRAELGPTGKHIKDIVTQLPRPVQEEPVKSAEAVLGSEMIKHQRGSGPKTRSFPFVGSATTGTREGSLFSKKQTGDSFLGGVRNKTAPSSAPPTAYPSTRDGGRDRNAGRGGYVARGSKQYGDNKKSRTQQDGFSSAKRHSKKRSSSDAAAVITAVPEQIKIIFPISVRSLAAAMKLRTAQLIAKMFMQGIALGPNDVLDQEAMVQLIGAEFGCAIGINTQVFERGQFFKKSISEEIEAVSEDRIGSRSPIIVFTGHVDHGKTSLIDAIRSSDRVKHEAGAITQHIGAFQAVTSSGEMITVLDTPGHEAFSAMRTRGIHIADIVVIVIAGDEGIKSQTDEAIQVAKKTNSSIIVAVTKSDKANFDHERIFRQLSEREMLPESWGGTLVTVLCSSHTGFGIAELLDMVQLQASILGLKADKNARARGVVVESCVDRGLGPSATLVLQNGTLHAGDIVVAGSAWGKMRRLCSDRGKAMTSVGPGFPVFVSGFSNPPQVGEDFAVVPSEQEARWATEVYLRTEGHAMANRLPAISPETFVAKGLGTQKRTLVLVVCADVYGSIEALIQAFKEIPSDRVSVEVVHRSVGVIGESLVSLASAAKAVIIGFNTTVDVRAQVMAKTFNVPVHLINIIYRAVELVTELMEKCLDKVSQEKFSGTAEVRAVFKSSKFGVIAGCGVTAGVVKRGQLVRISRNGKVLQSGKILSMRTGKDDLKESNKGFECGIIVDNFTDFQVGDEIRSVDVVYLAQGLLACNDEKQE